jgi:FKBP-type peptidyl-prolyl cis-trans isomerase
LEENKTKEGVIETESGLQYKVIEEGTGKSPKADDKVRCHYRGTLLNGDEFDSSYKMGQPAEFVLNRVISGWTEGLQLMKEGGKYELYIPSHLAYGPRGGGQTIEPNMTLIFEIELLEVLDADTNE